MKVKQETFVGEEEFCDWLTEFCEKHNSNQIIGMVKSHGLYEVFYKSFTEDDKWL